MQAISLAPLVCNGPLSQCNRRESKPVLLTRLILPELAGTNRNPSSATQFVASSVPGRRLSLPSCVDLAEELLLLTFASYTPSNSSGRQAFSSTTSLEFSSRKTGLSACLPTGTSSPASNMSDFVSLVRKLVLESPPGEWATNKIRELIIGALKQGPIPQHVAFEMDGNRRYARSHRMETIEGHHHGFEALARV